ncbi:hypothetical protein Tco_1503588 [Tanacetum coccineum]
MGKCYPRHELSLEQTQQGDNENALVDIEGNIRVILHSIYSDDGNPSSTNIKQALRSLKRASGHRKAEHELTTQSMSPKNGVNPPAPNPTHNSNFSLLSVLGRERRAGPNYMDWMQNLRFTLRYENKEYVLDEQIPTINDDSTQEEIEAHQKHYDDANKVSCIMASSMIPKLQKTFENT